MPSATDNPFSNRLGSRDIPSRDNDKEPKCCCSVKPTDVLDPCRLGNTRLTYSSAVNRGPYFKAMAARRPVNPGNLTLIAGVGGVRSLLDMPSRGPLILLPIVAGKSQSSDIVGTS